jgi:segregation and condensation protein B
MTDAETETVAPAVPPELEEGPMAEDDEHGKKRRAKKKRAREEPAPEAAAEPAPDEDADDDLPAEASARAPEELVRAVSALVFASPDPLTLGRIAKLVAADGGARPSRPELEAALDAIRERLTAAGLGLELRAIAGGWQLLTADAASETVQKLFQERKVERVSPAALETLAVIAYRQPVTKAEIEAIRGVQAGPILRNLVDRGLVKVTGRAEQPGHPLQYGTTRLFLERFGLADLGDLPRDGELARD